MNIKIKSKRNFFKLSFLLFFSSLTLDFNKITIDDEGEWFKNVFVTGPGFQIAQIFVESIFDQHVDWAQLIKTDDNYKNKLQVLIQKEFKNIEVNYEEKDKLMPERGTLNIDKAKKLLNYNPKYPLEIGYEKYIKWYKSFWQSIK